MSETCPNSIYIPVTVSPSLSGYTRISEFTFTPNLTGDFANKFYKDISESKVVWDFGDGYTLSATESLQATHRYKYPGVYTVVLYYYDSEGNALLNSYTSSVSVSNFYTNKITFKTGSKPRIYTGELDKEKNKIPYQIQVTWQDYNIEGNSIFFSVSGSDADLYDSTYKYAYLLPYRGLYTYNNGLELLKRNKQVVNLTPQYYVLVNNVPTLTANPSPLSSAYILGAIGTSDIYYYDDTSGDRKIFAAIETSNHTLPEYYVNNINTELNLSNLNYQEVSLDYIDVEIIKAKSTKLLLTSTGNKNMLLPNYKRQGDKFQVFVSPSNSKNDNHKFYDKLYYSNEEYNNSSIGYFTVTIGDRTTDTTGTSSVTSTLISSVSTDKYPYNSSLSSSELSSYFYFNYTPNNVGTYTLYVSGRPSSATDVLTGSYTFTVLPSAGDEFYKINELDFDYASVIKSYRFQEFLLDYDNLFDGVLGSIVGTLSSSPTSYGKYIFEKISNYVLNVSDVDTCNIDILQKMYDIFNEKRPFNNPVIPPSIKRLYDLYSIRFRRLMGMKEKFGDSYDTFYSSNSAYAKNIDFNNPIDSNTYIVTAGQPFVAIQKFGNIPILIEPMNVPVSTIDSGSTSAYPLSNFNLSSNWGWKLDDSYVGVELDSIYDFYPYISYYNEARKNNILDYTAYSHNTLNDSISSVSKWNVEIYKNIDFKIREGLNL